MQSTLSLRIFQTISITYAALLTVIGSYMLYLNYLECEKTCTFGLQISAGVLSVGIIQLLAHLIILLNKKASWVLLVASLLLNLGFNFYLVITSPHLPLQDPLSLILAMFFNPAFPTAIPLFLFIYVLLLHKQFFAR